MKVSRIFWVTVFLLLVVGLSAGCGKNSTENKNKMVSDKSMEQEEKKEESGSIENKGKVPAIDSEEVITDDENNSLAGAKADSYYPGMVHRYYIENRVNVINQGDFMLSENFILKDSDFFKQNEDYVKSQISRKAIQELVDIRVIEFEDTNDGNDYRFFSSETISTQYPGDPYVMEETSYWIYTVVNIDGDWVISERVPWKDKANSNRLKYKTNPDYQMKDHKLTEEAALYLRYRAAEKFEKLISGGEQCMQQEFEDRKSDVRYGSDGQDSEEYYYYYYCEDLNSLDKIKTYLKQSFSDEIINELIESSSVKMINNKLAYVPQGEAGILIWDYAEIRLKEEEGKRKKYQFNVMDIGESENEIEIEYVYEEGRGWLIATNPMLFRGK